MENKKDIMTLEQIKVLVDTFYGKVRDNEMLAPIFNERIEDRWPEHLAKMYAFWQTILLGDHTYFGAPFVPHANLPVSKEHFDQWMELFIETVDELFEGAVADEAKWRAGKMAEMFQIKLAHIRQTGSKNIL